MNETFGSWDDADSANYDLNDEQDAHVHAWTPAHYLPEDCLWDECED